jgi:DNA-binding response OmpR family regulator
MRPSTARLGDVVCPDARPGAHATDPDSSRPLVLVVENDRLVSRLLSIILDQAGYQVVRAFDGQAAIRTARRRRPDVITLDWALGLCHGSAVLQALKEHPATAEIPVVIVSAYHETIGTAYRKLAAAVLSKPFRAHELERTIADVLPSHGRVVTSMPA